MRRLLADRRPFEGIGSRDRGALGADRCPQARRVRLRHQPGHRHRPVEVGVAQEAGAVGEGAAHRFGYPVHVGCRAVAGGAQVPAFEHVQHLHQRHPAGARRWHRQHGMAAVGAPDRLAHPRRVGGQIRQGDESAVRRHLARQQLGGASGVEPAWSLLRNPLQRRRQVRLPEAVACRVRHSSFREGGHRRRVARHPRQDGRQRRGPVVGQDETVARQGDGRLQQPPPRQAAMIHPGAVQPGHRAGHADRGMAVVVAPGVIDAAGHEHLGGRGGRGGLAEVVGGRGAVDRAVHQEPAAADVPRGRVGDRQHERGGYGGIDGRAARPQRLDTGLGGERVRGDHHAAFRARRRRLGHDRCAREQKCAGGGCLSNGAWG